MMMGCREEIQICFRSYGLVVIRIESCKTKSLWLCYFLGICNGDQRDFDTANDTLATIRNALMYIMLEDVDIVEIAGYVCEMLAWQ